MKRYILFVIFLTIITPFANAQHKFNVFPRVADGASCRVVEVESDVVVPVEEASEKQEYGARTIRAKLHRKWPTFLVDLAETKPKHSSLALRVAQRAAILEAGRIVLQGSAAELGDHPDVREAYLGIAVSVAQKEWRLHRRRRRW